MLYSKDEPPKTVTKPDYPVLRIWFAAWPEARPELLDFWVRGGYLQRVMWRRQQNKPAVVVSVRYLDEIDAVIRRLALLDLELDIVWSGDVSRSSLLFAPQDIDYEGVGGWGYITCSGDKLADHRRGREWCPALAWASLLPDTVTDWLDKEAADFFFNGDLLVCPADAVGIPKRSTQPTEPPEFGYSTQIRSLRKDIEMLFTIDMPILDQMSLPDVHKFCHDYAEELHRYRRAMSALLSPEPTDTSTSHRDVAAEIHDAIAELKLSEKGKGMRHALAAAGGVLASAQLAVAVNAGANYGSLGLTAASAALAAAKWWNEKITADRERRTNPYWVLWRLQGKPGRPMQFNSLRFDAGLGLPKRGPVMNDMPTHWLAPPTGGWTIPTAIAPQA